MVSNRLRNIVRHCPSKWLPVVAPCVSIAALVALISAALRVPLPDFSHGSGCRDPEGRRTCPIGLLDSIFNWTSPSAHLQRCDRSDLVSARRYAGHCSNRSSRILCHELHNLHTLSSPGDRTADRRIRSRPSRALDRCARLPTGLSDSPGLGLARSSRRSGAGSRALSLERSCLSRASSPRIWSLHLSGEQPAALCLSSRRSVRHDSSVATSDRLAHGHWMAGHGVYGLGTGRQVSVTCRPPQSSSCLGGRGADRSWPDEIRFSPDLRDSFREPDCSISTSERMPVRSWRLYIDAVVDRGGTLLLFSLLSLIYGVDEVGRLEVLRASVAPVTLTASESLPLVVRWTYPASRGLASTSR